MIMHRKFPWPFVGHTKFCLSGLHQVGRSIVVHRLTDWEALMLFIWWYREPPLIVGQLGASLIILFRCWSRLSNLIARRGRGYRLRFRPSGVHDRIISIQRLSFRLQYSLSSLRIFPLRAGGTGGAGWANAWPIFRRPFVLFIYLLLLHPQNNQIHTAHVGG